MKYLFDPDMKWLKRVIVLYVVIFVVLVIIFPDQRSRVFFAPTLAVLGLIFIFAGYVSVWMRRTVENIPTTTIATGAVGSNVEIEGAICMDDQERFQGPLSGKWCSGFLIEFQQWSTSDPPSWATLDSLAFLNRFYVNDGSGALAQVDLEEARFLGVPDASKTVELNMDQLKNLPEKFPELNAAIELYRKNNKFSLKPSMSTLTGHKFRFVERSYFPGDTIYIFGFARSGHKHSAQPRESAQAANTTMVFRHSREHPLFLSSHKEENLTRILAKKAKLYFMMGMVICVISGLAFLQSLGS